MAVRNVTRSSGIVVELVLDRISDFRSKVVINVPNYNGQFTFVRKSAGRDRWVQLLSREKLDPAVDAALLHVSKSVFYGMAEWACAILNAKRLVGEKGISTDFSPEPILWGVFWKATDGDHEVARVKAVSDKQARYRGWREWTAGNFPGVTFDLMYAVPASGNKYVRTLGGESATTPKASSTPPGGNSAPPGTGEATQLLLYGT